MRLHAPKKQRATGARRKCYKIRCRTLVRAKSQSSCGSKVLFRNQRQQWDCLGRRRTLGRVVALVRGVAAAPAILGIGSKVCSLVRRAQLSPDCLPPTALA